LDVSAGSDLPPGIMASYFQTVTIKAKIVPNTAADDAYTAPGALLKKWGFPNILIQTIFRRFGKPHPVGSDLGQAGDWRGGALIQGVIYLRVVGSLYKRTPPFLNNISLSPHPQGGRPERNGFSHGLKTCHRHVFLTAFRVPTGLKIGNPRKRIPNFWSECRDSNPRPLGPEFGPG